MKRSVFIGLMCCLATIGVAATSWAAEEEKQKTPEQKAWEQVDSLNKQSLQDFLKQFPDRELAKHAKVAVELQAKFGSIKKGESKAAFTISPDVLGKNWGKWRQRNPEKGVGGYYANKESIGVFPPDPLTGGKTHSAVKVDFLHRLQILSPTGDGSIIAFRTGGFKFEVFDGIVFETPGNEPMYFGVMAGKGLVHLKGVGKVTLPDGKITDLK